jgi:hypothetical protein
MASKDGRVIAAVEPIQIAMAANGTRNGDNL